MTMTTTIDVPTAQKAESFEANLAFRLQHQWLPYRGLLAAFSPDATQIHVVAEDMTELLRRLSVHNIATETVVIERVPGERPPKDNPWPEMKIDLVQFRRNNNQVSFEYLVAFWGKQVAWHADGTHIVASADTHEGLAQRIRELGIDPFSVVYDYVDDPNVGWV